jgi:Domain of unknown function (DUF3459)
MLARVDNRLGWMGVTVDGEANWLIVGRGPVTVACNLATRAQRVSVGREHSSQVLLTSDAMIEVNATGMALPPESAVILGPAEP